MKLLVKNGIILTPFRKIENAGLLIEDGKITEVLENEDQVKNIELSLSENRIGDNYADYNIIDAGRNYIAPGFIDIHTHGAGGHDFMDGTVDAISGAAKAHMQHGTTSIVPTTLTSTTEDLYRTLDNFKKAKRDQEGPELLGLHLEGPYFSMEQRGAQDPRFIKNPDREEYLKLLN
ncbi:MAG TPA: amidohydrolase family protein [Thermoanaerobacterales bacterium]|nr:amidohydrolase family protein [Thermoanaerobacterales bacterium]